MKNLTRYSPGAYGAMTQDPDGDYVRLSEIEPLVRKAVDNAKDSGIFAGSLIAEENAEELANLRDLLRWRDAITDMPTERGEYLVRFEYGNESWHEVIRWVPDFLSMGIHATHWRPIGPLPEGGEG